MATGTVTTGSQQWLRYVQVVVGKGGSGISIDQLRIKFEITKTMERTPNPAKISIYNLNPNNESLIQNEFTDIIVNAGYQGSSRMIFTGSLKHVFKYRDGNDYITQIEAGDGDSDYVQSYMNITLAPGTSEQDVVKAALASFKNGTVGGYTQVGTNPYIRGKVISGTTRDLLTKLAKNNGANWSIQDGALTLVKVQGVLPGTAIVVNSNTGMIGAPEVNDKGIAVKCLLNPQIKVQGAIQLDNNSIKQYSRNARLFGGSKQKTANTPARLDPDGIYKVIKLIHRGDTRSNEFVTDIACVALNSPIPSSNDTSGDDEESGEVQ